MRRVHENRNHKWLIPQDLMSFPALDEIHV